MKLFFLFTFLTFNTNLLYRLLLGLSKGTIATKFCTWKQRLMFHFLVQGSTFTILVIFNSVIRLVGSNLLRWTNTNAHWHSINTLWLVGKRRKWFNCLTENDQNKERDLSLKVPLTKPSPWMISLPFIPPIYLSN